MGYAVTVSSDNGNRESSFSQLQGFVAVCRIAMHASQRLLCNTSDPHLHICVPVCRSQSVDSKDCNEIVEAMNMNESVSQNWLTSDL